MRVFATHLVIGSQEREIQQRHTPEEREPGRQVKFAGSTWHGSSRCFPMVEVFAREHFNNRGRIDSRALSSSQPTKGTTASEPSCGRPLYHVRDERRDTGERSIQRTELPPERLS